MTAIIELPQILQGQKTELLGLIFELSPRQAGVLGEHYAKGLHAWFLHQLREVDPALSAYLHDGQTEKAFAMSRLWIEGDGARLAFKPGCHCEWSLHCLSEVVVAGVVAWLQKRSPQVMHLGEFEFAIKRIDISLPATTYQELWQKRVEYRLGLSFLSPTGFRRKGHHFPLPVPRNVFQSYLRRWNDFSSLPIESGAFLEWVDEFVVVRKHQLETRRVAAGKQGMMTGFIGSAVFNVVTKGRAQSKYCRLFSALGWLAPYCGTGHKTTFGLGQTVLGVELVAPVLSAAELSAQILGERIEELQEIFLAQRQRQGGDRARRIAELWAELLARRERGEALGEIAADLGISYGTAKSYVKLARQSLQALGSD
ncbi:CRISPR-associated endoribonuclease Cas6 [Picosynechococcus sp. NKBG15041c]|uniref:CRISPR-associated endoribonuclease Cas6 n=1 Tax=Picosynechococcus sp. NKBG15041c TaxID=1407650 RepID=UPI000465F67D|nr:CRISPR-associated endoribonuclease Cas6 [Picosynechococcus sp. NKBG15041c]